MSCDFEAWKIDLEFIEREDWRSLVRYRERMANLVRYMSFML